MILGCTRTRRQRIGRGSKYTLRASSPSCRTGTCGGGGGGASGGLLAAYLRSRRWNGMRLRHRQRGRPTMRQYIRGYVPIAGHLMTRRREHVLRHIPRRRRYITRRAAIPSHQTTQRVQPQAQTTPAVHETVDPIHIAHQTRKVHFGPRPRLVRRGLSRARRGRWGKW